MAANRKSIIASAAALLLAIAAAITAAGSRLDHTSYTYSFKANGQVITVWGPKPKCGHRELMLMHGNNYMEEPWLMSKLLKIQSGHHLSQIPMKMETSRMDYAQELYLYSIKGAYTCQGLNILNFLKLVSMCGNEDHYKRYADFIIHYAPDKFAPCARDIIQTWSKHPDSVLAGANQFFRAGLDLGDEELKEGEMYDKVKDVNLLTTKFNVTAMVEVARKMWGPQSSCIRYPGRVAPDLKHTLAELIEKFYPDVNVVKVARGLNAIKEDELTYRFKLIDKYIGFAFQIQNRRHFTEIEYNFHR